ncbi:MAG: polyphenol oxidase family protein, partial [Chloroflexota bacterium]|nr:polyphenol oxidase family protein [Chloroflexota bacterium]
APGDPPAEGDAVITRLSGLLLAVQVADCLPVLIVDWDKRILAAAHAGWRGLLAGVVPKTLAAMQSRYASDPRCCLAVIGPSIGPCCYEVGQDVVLPFEEAFPGRPQLWRNFRPPGRALSSGTGISDDPPSARRMLDLSAACRFQLESAGLPDRSVLSHPPCTSCHRDVFHSYRAEGGSTGRMLAAIGKIH